MHDDGHAAGTRNGGRWLISLILVAVIVWSLVAVVAAAAIASVREDDVAAVTDYLAHYKKHCTNLFA